MFYWNLKRLLITAPAKYRYYRKISRNIDFMRRYTLLGISYIINAFLWGLIKKGIEKMHILLEKQFVFKTPFGTFMGSTVNQWTVLAPDYEPAIQKVIRKCTEKTEISERVVVNIGAHIGRYAIELVSNYHYTAYCFEPNPATFKTLQTNTILSHIEDRCFLFPYALGDKEEEWAFEHIGYNDGSSRILQWTEKKINRNHVITVPVKVFDELHSDIEPSLIIMDVEGFEYHVIKWMSNALMRYGQVDVIMEIFRDNTDKENVLQFMRARWYYYKNIDKDNIHFRKI